MITEADTCRKYILPKVYDAGWTDDMISEQKTFTDGRIMVIGDKVINEKINQSDWENVVQLVINGIKSKQMTKGIIEAIEVCQKLLLDNGFNVRRDDVNELHDAIRIEE